MQQELITAAASPQAPLLLPGSENAVAQENNENLKGQAALADGAEEEKR